MTTVRDGTYRLMRALGLTTIFGNPGSTEEPFFQDFPADFTYVLGLHEASVVAMADGYTQAMGRALPPARPQQHRRDAETPRRRDAETPGMPPMQYDGITELWFDDVESLARCFSDWEYLQRIHPDEEAFLDLHAYDFVVSSKNTIKP